MLGYHYIKHSCWFGECRHENLIFAAHWIITTKSKIKTRSWRGAWLFNCKQISKVKLLLAIMLQLYILLYILSRNYYKQTLIERRRGRHWFLKFDRNSNSLCTSLCCTRGQDVEWANLCNVIIWKLHELKIRLRQQQIQVRTHQNVDKIIFEN